MYPNVAMLLDDTQVWTLLWCLDYHGGEHTFGLCAIEESLEPSAYVCLPCMCRVHDYAHVGAHVYIQSRSLNGIDIPISGGLHINQLSLA